MNQHTTVERLQEIADKFLDKATETNNAQTASRSLQVVSQAVALANEIQSQSQSDFHVPLFLSRLQHTVSRTELYGCYLEFCRSMRIEAFSRTGFYKIVAQHCHVYKSGPDRKVVPMTEKFDQQTLLQLPATIRMPKPLPAPRRKR